MEQQIDIKYVIIGQLIEQNTVLNQQIVDLKTQIEDLKPKTELDKKEKK